MEDEDHLRAYIIASSAGVYSLFPLLIKPIGKANPDFWPVVLTQSSWHRRNPDQSNLYPPLVRPGVQLAAESGVSVKFHLDPS